MFRSATFRLTVSYLAIVVVISVLFSAVVYHVGTDDLAFGLHHQMQRISTDFPVFDNSPFLRPGNDLSNDSHRLLGRLIAFNIIVFIGAGFASYWLARRTLTPIEQAHEQQKRFTADVSHELRTPLTALKMEAEVALLDPKTTASELRQVLSSNIEEAEKLDTLINSLLRLTRLEAGELQQNFVALDAGEITAEAIQHVQKLADASKITIDEKSAALQLLGDRDSLVQLLVILLDNAIKYSPAGSTIKIAAKKDHGEAVISIIDAGMGIEPAALNHVFERFYRADASRTKSDSDGFGLGLSIAKLIADVHHATITLTSRAGKGTTATIKLPLSEK